MLQKLGDHITTCVERAEQCKAAASSAIDPLVQSQLSDLALQWQHVAQSYEFIASLEKFLLDAQKNALPHEVERLPKDSPHSPVA